MNDQRPSSQRPDRPAPPQERHPKVPPQGGDSMPLGDVITICLFLLAALYLMSRL